MDPAIPEIEDVPSLLLPCTKCQRTFRPEALAKHTKVCDNILKKRKAFDSAKQRIQGTEIENYVSTPPPRHGARKGRGEGKEYARARSREKVDLGKIIQSAKKTSTDATQIKPSDHEECPFCGRSFGPKAYDRHTDFCREQHLKLQATPNVNPEAKERLKVRTTYKGPLTNKVLTTRDRYQPKRDPSPVTADLDPGLRTRGLTRNSSLRSSLRVKATESTPPPPVRSHTLSQISPTKSRRASTDHETKTPNQFLKQGTPRLVRKEEPDRKEADKYNPYISAERQMLELFGGDKPVKIKSPTTTLPEIRGSSPLQSSPTSAFAKYSSPTRSISTESLNKENNNVMSPDGSKSENFNMNNKANNFNLSSLSLCSVVSLDSIDCNRNPKLASYRADEFQRSFSAIESKPRSGGRSKVNLQEMLYGAMVSDDQAVHSEESSSSDPGNLEACEQELLISMLEFEKMLKSSPIPSLHSSPTLCSSTPVDVTSSKANGNETENIKKNLNQGSNDSAYSSLTRSSAAEGDHGTSEHPYFCHECGAKFPVAAAKFCCNCGMKRLVF